MAEAPEAEYAEAAEISFELEQLTLSDDHRLELTGRWFGVRGRRFMRPTLTLIAANTRSRSLADLEHKPWAAEDGEPWVAAFPLQAPAEEVLELELAVAPDIAVMLAPPPELAQLPRARVASSDAVVSPRAGSPPVAAAPERDELDTALADELTSARAALEEQRLKIERLEQELERAAGAEVELRSALSRRDAAVEKLDAVIEQHAAAEREQAAAEAEREAAARELADALRERDEARTGWTKAHEGRRNALLERDTAVADRQRAVIDRDHATAARDRAISQRDQAIADRDRARSERPEPPPATVAVPVTPPPAPAAARAAPAARPRPAARPARAARPATPEFSHRPSPIQRGRASPAAVWAGRVFALLVLLAAVITIAIIVHSA